ncbi:MAG TPA: hypothetical protein VJ949_14025 [Cryomorphaceae bacterium]|nr:hypothetical protein [Cryomorphaceae bacterium]
MKASKSKSIFTRDLIVIAILVCAGAWVSANFLLEQQVPFSFWLSFAILTIASFFIHRFLVKANDKRPQIFVASFMGSLTAKLFLSAIILVMVGVLDKENLKFTAIGYLIGYMLFLVAEIKNLLPLIRSSSR